MAIIIVCMYACVCMCVCVCEREREREREGGRGRGRGRERESPLTWKLPTRSVPITVRKPKKKETEFSTWTLAGLSP